MEQGLIQQKNVIRVPVEGFWTLKARYSVLLRCVVVVRALHNIAK